MMATGQQNYEPSIIADILSVGKPGVAFGRYPRDIDLVLLVNFDRPAMALCR